MVSTLIKVESNRTTALKTMSLRLTSTKTELEELGEDTEYAAETLSEYRKVILGLTHNTTKPVDIFDSNGQYKNTTQIIRELSAVFDQMDSLEQNALMNTLFGKRQGNIGASLLQNFDMVEKSIKIVEESSEGIGSAMEEQNRWAESLEAKYGHIEAIFESISSKVFDSESLKKIMDSLGNILEMVDSLVSKGKGLQLLGGTIGGILGASGNGLINVNTFGGYWKDVNDNLKVYNQLIKSTSGGQTKLIAQIAESNIGLSNYLNNLNGSKASLVGYIASTAGATIKTIGLRVAVTALNFAINAGLMVAISAVITAVGHWINHNKELTESFVETSNQVKSNISQLEDYKNKISEIINSEKTETEKLGELKNIKDELSTTYQKEIDDINNVTEARNNLNDAIDEQIKHERELYVAQNEQAYNLAKNKINDRDTGFSWNNIWNGLKGNTNDVGVFELSNQLSGKQIKLSDDIKNLFNVDKDYDTWVRLSLGNGTEDEIEYFDLLEKKYAEFQKIRTLRKDGLTQDEEDLYQMVSQQYEMLKEKNKDYIDTIKTMSQQKALYLMDITEQGTMNDAEYLSTLIELADGDKYVINSLKDIIRNSKDAQKAIEDTNNPLSSVIANNQVIAKSLDQIHEKIGKADEQFEKLTQTIEENKDVDKFFSASDIIELLDLYPELNDAILETAYGYKIDEEAIEALRQAKIDEKKIALQAQLDETQGLLDATKKKLELYKQELGGIKDVAMAKAKLAELEARTARGIAGTTNPYYDVDRNTSADMAMYKDFIEAAEAADKYQQEIDKLGIEIKVLGNSFDKAKDATEDQTKALNDQKKAIDELKDGYDDAKKAIEDLIELTMAMLKKNAELEKEALKEELDGFKKLIDKRKELIDLEKQQYDFEKDLKEQNKDLLKIQQELDALSVEGVNYSLEDLKRKAELEEKVAEQKSKRDDFLYDHEVDVRKDALDKEQELFEDQINTQIKSIEDYLDHEGKIRAEAVDLINGKSQQFYDNLLDYTMNYTKKSRYEFDKLWQDAYDAILKYANGELNVEMALINIINAMELAENQLKSIDAALNNIKNSTDDAKKAMYDFLQVTSDTKAKLDEINNMPTKSAINYSTDPRFSDPEYAKLLTKQAILGGKNGKNAMDLIKQIRGYHTGGIVEGVSTQHGEVLAKLLSGEVVVTEKQARNFMENTLPKLATNTTTNNQSIAPVINIGDININGNADRDTVSQLNAVRQSIVDDVFKAVNRQNSTFNGMRPRFV